MSSKSATCITCHSVLSADETVSGICPRCLLAVGSTPRAGGPTHTDPLKTGWNDAFPQFEPGTVLSEEDGFIAMTGTLVSDALPGGHGPAALLIWSGSALAAEGGLDVLLARIEALRLGPISGMAPIVDAGDLADAVFLMAKLPPGALAWDESGDGPTARPEAEVLATFLPPLGQLLASVQGTSGIQLQLDPRLVFRDPDGEPVLIPRPALPGAESPADGEGVERAVRGRGLRAGIELGPYMLVEQIGEGGFGKVWKARQECPAKRTVAVKVLKHGLTSPRVRARFEVEQQALALLDHSHIARFFSGGTTPDGRPFFAMEWIEGASITDYCRDTGASLDARLALFGQVCTAVRQAHRKGIIHRDLKASNVMVSTESGEAAVKVIDFGIAKAVEEPLTDRTLLTRAEEILGTPASMSPEQAAGRGGSELDARTDVYGLGVLLYELLCDALPFDESLPTEELCRRIKEDDPPRPSTRVQDPEQRKALRGDLDWIVMRCLEKDPDRRYDSVSALADDLERHHREQPVTAGPPELSYRLQKFIRRNRLALSAATVASLAIVVGGIAMAIGLITAREERANAVQALEDSRREAAIAEAVSRFLSEELLALEETGGLVTADPRNENITLRTVLERAASRIDGRFTNQPEVEGMLRYSLGTSFLAVGDLERAEEHATRAATLLESSLGADNARFWKALRLLASVHAARGHYAQADTQLARLGSLTDSKLGTARRASALAGETGLIRADLLLEQGDVLKARDAYEVLRSSEDLAPEIQAQALSGLARARESWDDRAEVVDAHQEAVGYATEHLGATRPLTLEIKRRCASFLVADLNESTDEEAARFVHLARGIRKQQEDLLGADHPATLRTRFDQAITFGEVAPMAESSLKDLQVIVTAAENCYQPDHPELLRMKLGLARQQARLGRRQTALEQLEELIRTSRSSVGLSHPVVVEATRLLGEQQRGLGRNEEALASFRQSVQRARTKLSPASTQYRQAVNTLGEFLWASPDTVPEAVEVYYRAYLDYADTLGERHLISTMALDRALLSFRHDRTGAAALAAARLALRKGGTHQRIIRSLLQMSLASQWSLRESYFGKPSIPLPEAYLQLLRVETQGGTLETPIAMPPLMVNESAAWQCLVLQEGEVPPPGWRLRGFDAGAWASGAGPVGFGYPGIATDLRANAGDTDLPVSVCLRHSWLVTEPNPDRPLLLRLRCSAGAAIWLNGKELLRVRLPGRGPLAEATRSTRPHGFHDQIDTLDYLVPAGALRPGTNVLAVRVFQAREPTAALLFSLEAYQDAPFPLDRLADFDPTLAQTHLDAWLPGLVPPMEADWKLQVTCMTRAALGDWEGALKLSRSLTPGTAARAGRHRWFQATALAQLARSDEARALLAKAIHPRDPNATAELIDLTEFYNARFDEAWHVLKFGVMHEPSLRNFPTGVHEFGGIRFDARGIIQLASPPFQQMIIRRFPEKVEGIPIAQRVAKLHLFNATVSYAEAGNTIATAMVHYDDGSKAEFPIRYWSETITYMAGAEKTPEEVTLAWRGPDPYRPGGDNALYVATWENPRPDVKVASIDLVAEPAAAALFVVGISVDRP